MRGFPVAPQVTASTLMLMGGNVSGIVSSVEAACMMSAGSACRLHRWQAVKVWCVCQRQTCKPVAGFPYRLRATIPRKSFGGLVGLSCGSVECQPQRSCWWVAGCPACFQLLGSVAGSVYRGGRVLSYKSVWLIYKMVSFVFCRLFYISSLRKYNTIPCSVLRFKIILGQFRSI